MQTDWQCVDPWHADAHLRKPKTDRDGFTPIPEGSTVRIGFDPATREVLYAKVEKPKKYAVNGRPITLGEYYDGNGPGDPPGRYYVYDDSPNVTHWMSTGAMVVRCKEIDNG